MRFKKNIVLPIRLANQKITILIISSTVIVLLLVDYLYFPRFAKINYLNLVFELFTAFIALALFIIAQRYKDRSFYRMLSLGFYLFFVSYFIDAIDQIFMHSIIYTVVMEKISLLFAAVFILIGCNQWIISFEKLAFKDDLTKLPNRKLTMKLFNQELVSSKKNETIFCIGIIDIDFFKRLNDEYGHYIGDIVLKDFATLLKKLKKEKDILGRWGGEEFLLIMKNIRREEAHKTLEKMRQKISEFVFEIEGNLIKVTVSIGVSEYQSPDDDHKSLFIKADKALYRCKNSGRNKVMS